MMKDFLLNICDKANLFSLFNPFTKNKASVFMIHHFGAAGQRDFKSLPADILENCLSYLVSKGYRAMALSEYVNRLADKESLYKTVVFTVDDGYKDFMEHGFPVFSKFNIPVSVFITTHFIDGDFSFWWDAVRDIVYRSVRPKIEIQLGDKKLSFHLDTDMDRERVLHHVIEYSKGRPAEEIDKVIDALCLACGTGNVGKQRVALSWNEVADLARQGVEFYPHTCRHPILSSCSDSRIQSEIVDSREMVASRIKTNPNIFCYPNGRFQDFDDRVIQVLKESGFIAAFTSEEGFDCSVRDPDMFRLRRFAFSFDTLRFKQIISGLESMKYSVRAALNGSRAT